MCFHVFTLPTVLACFSTFLSNSLCHSLCLSSEKTAGFHGAILQIRKRWAMGAAQLTAQHRGPAAVNGNRSMGCSRLAMGGTLWRLCFFPTACQRGASASVHVNRVVVDGPTRTGENGHKTAGAR